MPATLLKTVGYLISALSVALLGLVAWDSAKHDETLRAAVLLGIAASMIGMALRWLSYQMETPSEGRPPAPMTPGEPAGRRAPVGRRP